MKEQKTKPAIAQGPFEPERRNGPDEYVRLVEHAHSQIDMVWKTWARVAGLVSLILGLFGVLFWKNLSDFKRDTREDFEQFKVRVQSQVQNRIDEQFKTDSIRALVEAKAVERVDAIAKPVIEAKIENVTRTQIAPLSASLAALSANMEAANRDFNVFQLFLKAQQYDGRALRALTVMSTNSQYTGSKVLSSCLADLRRQYQEEKGYCTVSYRKADGKKSCEAIHRSPDGVIKSMDEIAGRQLRPLVKDIVALATNDNQPVSVQINAVFVLEKVTGRKFGDFPPFDDVAAWWKLAGATNREYRSPFAEIGQGRSLYGEGKLDEAVNILSNAVSGCDGMAETHGLLARIHQSKGDMAMAIAEFEQAVNAADNQADIMRDYAALLVSEGKKQEAIRLLMRHEDEEDFVVGTVKGDERFKSLQGEPEYERLRRIAE